MLAQELGKVLKEPMAVSSADFVDSKEAELYRFGSLERQLPEVSLVASFQLAFVVAPVEAL